MSQILTPILALVPVLAFLGLLRLMDSYKLTPAGRLVRALFAGATAAGASLATNLMLANALDLSDLALKRYQAPLVEEVLKAAFVIFLLRAARAGFLVDSAIYGFAVGAGFAVVENLYYLRTLVDPQLMVWVVRGLGTAVMHGSTVAIFAILSKVLTERRSSLALHWFLPGLAAAFIIHSTFNHFPLPPLVSTAVMLAVFPALFILVFERSEKATQSWLGEGFDLDSQLLELINSGDIRHTRVGRYLGELQERFPGPVVGDMLSLLQINTELSMRAKGILMAREAGLEVPVGSDIQPKLEELRYLHDSIGPTGMLAIQPFLGRGSRELWQRFVLET